MSSTENNIQFMSENMIKTIVIDIILVFLGSAFFWKFSEKINESILSILVIIFTVIIIIINMFMIAQDFRWDNPLTWFHLIIGTLGYGLIIFFIFLIMYTIFVHNT